MGRANPKSIRHGTSYAEAQRCYKRAKRLDPVGGRCCDACRKIWTAYAKEYRHKNPRVARDKKLVDNARQRALWTLAREYPDRFHELVEDEKLKIPSVSDEDEGM